MKFLENIINVIISGAQWTAPPPPPQLCFALSAVVWSYRLELYAAQHYSNPLLKRPKSAPAGWYCTFIIAKRRRGDTIHLFFFFLACARGRKARWTAWSPKTPLQVSCFYIRVSYLFFFWGGGRGWKFWVKKLIITQKPHTVFGFVCGSTQRIVGFSLSWRFPTWKRGKRDHLSTLWQKILQESNLTHGPLSRHSNRPTQAPA